MQCIGFDRACHLTLQLCSVFFKKQVLEIFQVELLIDFAAHVEFKNDFKYYIPWRNSITLTVLEPLYSAMAPGIMLRNCSR